jgi:uncharacterized protein (DUF1684 family)
MAKLRAADGYLNLAALYWLDEGRHSFGASADNDLVFPNALAERIGYLEVEDGRVTMLVNDGELVLMDQQPVRQAALEPVTDGSPVPAQMGSQFWYVIERVGKLGLRLHDLENPALERLPPMPYFDINRRFRVTGRLRTYPEPRRVSVSTVIDGLPYEPESPGVVEFELDGRAFALEAYTSGDELFFVFGDATSGRETYGAGRFLYSPAPGEDGLTVLDFNQSYNPPCAFNDFSTCPVASPRNRLDVRIEAGELYDPSLYVGEVAYK